MELQGSLESAQGGLAAPGPADGRAVPACHLPTLCFCCPHHPPCYRSALLTAPLGAIAPDVDCCIESVKDYNDQQRVRNESACVQLLSKVPGGTAQV